MTGLPSATPIVNAVLAERGITDWSLVGGRRLSNIIHQAIERDRAVNQRRRTLTFNAQDVAFEFDEESSDEAWWINLQLHDPEQAGRMIIEILAELSMSDVEWQGVVDEILRMIAEGRERFR